MFSEKHLVFSKILGIHAHTAVSMERISSSVHWHPISWWHTQCKVLMLCVWDQGYTKLRSHMKSLCCQRYTRFIMCLQLIFHHWPSKHFTLNKVQPPPHYSIVTVQSWDFNGLYINTASKLHSKPSRKYAWQTYI